MSSQTRKFSQFVQGGAAKVGDQFAGLRDGKNTMFDSVTGGGGAVTHPIEQAAHGFTGTEWVRWDLSTSKYILALGNNAVNAEVAGVVSLKVDDDNFILQQVGYNETTFIGAGLMEGIYFLSTTVAGAMTLSTPQNSGEVRKVLFNSVDAPNDEGWVMNMIGKVVGTQDPGPGTGENEIIVVQPAHGFSVEQAVRADPGTPGFFVLALSDTEVNAQAVG
ncbi:MAG TPA: hypothetical protein ENG03_05325, partial [Thioploca sp.]|nr:hypothetical protein [Thioploca sp.]